MSDDQLPGVDPTTSTTPTGVPATKSTSEDGQKGSAGQKTTADPTIKGVKIRIFLDRVMEGMFPSSLQRLRNALPSFQEDLYALKRRNEGKPSDLSAVHWKESAERLLKQAHQAVDARDSEQGWQCLNAAGRFMLYGLGSDVTDQVLLKNQAIIIADTAADDTKGLSAWRRKSIAALLKDNKDTLKTEIPVGALVEAKRILDEHNDNVYRRLSILKSRLLLLTVAGVAFLAIWLFILKPPVPQVVVSGSASNVSAPAGANTTSGGASAPSASSAVTTTLSGASGLPVSPGAIAASGGANAPAVSSAAAKAPAGAGDQSASARNVADRFWWAVVLAGLLGGLISAFTSAIRSDIRKTNIPAELSTQTVTFARLMLAALSALAVTLFLTSGLLSFGQLSYELIIAIAIISGFTDRLLLRAVEQVAKPS
jgi:hypothetical protein